MITNFLDCAEACDADYIVTNDVHLLDLRYYGRTAIVPSASFPEELLR